jgi:hypothetical protein
VPHLLIAADAEWLIDDVRSALEGPDTTFAICRTGQAVTVAATQQAPDLPSSTCRSATWAAWPSA